MKIEAYGLIGDTQTAALVGINGSIDWLCLPRFDSGACFAALLGTEENGCWQISPAEPAIKTTRRYRPGTLILDTDFETASGVVRLTDFMPIRQHNPLVARVVTGLRGQVAMKMKLIIRFDYGEVRPWVTGADHGLQALAGPNAVVLRTALPTHGQGYSTVADFTVEPGEPVTFALHWYPSHENAPGGRNLAGELAGTEKWWHDWQQNGTYRGNYAEAVQSSTLALKALTYAPTGGIVAAVTTSLPESLGGSRNWDYRFCWLRDAAFTLDALLAAGYREEAVAWRNWLLRAIGGDASIVQSLYGVTGERRLPEIELPHLPGYEGSRPVRIGNAAYTQCQTDIYGEVIDALHRARMEAGISKEHEDDAWSLQQKLLEFLADRWTDNDNGMWEIRGELRAYTYSKVMAWVAFDRTVQAAEKFSLQCDLPRWRKIRDAIRTQVEQKGFNSRLGVFTQSYGSEVLDAAALRFPLVGFLPADDPRMLATVRAVEERLCQTGFVMRYTAGTDRMAGLEGAFLPCSFWLVENYALTGRLADARTLFERLLALRNDLGLLSEEYDPRLKRQLGNFPQAFSHIALVNAAVQIAAAEERAAAGAKPKKKTG